MIDLKMWGLALTNMPRVDTTKWQTLDPIAKWLIATRASVLFMTFTAAGLGGLLAWRDDLFLWQPWLATTLGLLFAHATNNLLNDFTDSRRGIDKNNYYRNQYGVHILEDGLVNTRQFWNFLGITGGIALLLGAWLVWQYSGQTLNLMLAGAFFVLFYTWPLKYYGMGEPAVLLVWGPLMVGGTYYVVTGHWSWDVCWLSLVFALGPTTVLFGKHTDKLEDDKAKRVFSMPVLLGEQLSRHVVITLLAAQYLLSIFLVASGKFSWPLLLVLLNLSNLWQTGKEFLHAKPTERPEHYPTEVWPLWFSALAFRHTRRFTGLFLLGVAIDVLFFG